MTELVVNQGQAMCDCPVLLHRYVVWGNTARPVDDLGPMTSMAQADTDADYTLPGLLDGTIAAFVVACPECSNLYLTITPRM